MLGVGKTKLHAVSPNDTIFVMRPWAFVRDVPLPPRGVDVMVTSGTIADDGVVGSWPPLVEVTNDLSVLVSVWILIDPNIELLDIDHEELSRLVALELVGLDEIILELDSWEALEDKVEDKEELVNRLLEDDAFMGGPSVLASLVGLAFDTVLLEMRKDSKEVKIKVLVVWFRAPDGDEGDGVSVVELTPEGNKVVLPGDGYGYEEVVDRFGNVNVDDMDGLWELVYELRLRPGAFELASDVIDNEGDNEDVVFVDVDTVPELVLNMREPLNDRVEELDIAPDGAAELLDSKPGGLEGEGQENMLEPGRRELETCVTVK
jgi:hypothetical protein